ncbi:uncharacterized protein LOC122320566 [Drosophila ficusphila]|uniref:uncharacterized protein LOC122320566 n=1 Tax=Drosophila ficusphila TaxID=30025 RepID=UPI001C8AA594|nr:uncharacterized protein LOC122320566 [Drosophila ficusphila]
MPAIKLHDPNSIHSRRGPQKHIHHECPLTIGACERGSCHSATNYFKSYCRIRRHGVNNSKTLCVLTLISILLAHRFGVAKAVGEPAAAVEGSIGGPFGGVAESQIGTCRTALGMESGAIGDSQITASSAHDLGNVGPQHAR